MKKVWFMIVVVVLGVFVSANVFASSLMIVETNNQVSGQKNDVNVKQITSDSELFPFKKGYFYGYMDKDGNVIIKPQFLHANNFSEGLAAISKEVGKEEYYGYINYKGDVIIPTKYVSASDFKDGKAYVELSETNMVTYIDKKGNFLFDKKFASASDFREGFAVVATKYHTIHYSTFNYNVPDSYSFINEKGQRATKKEFDHVTDCYQGFYDGFRDGYAAVNKGGKWGLIDKHFNVVINYQYGDMRVMMNGIIPVYKDGKWGFINLKNKVVIDFKYQQGSNNLFQVFPEGLACVCKNGKWGFINYKGKTVIDFKYDGICDGFCENRAYVELSGKGCFINIKGEPITPFKFIATSSFSEGVASVETSDGKWGIIDSNGKFIMKPKYEYIAPCENGLMLAGDKGSAIYPESDQFYITKTGKIIKPKIN